MKSFTIHIVQYDSNFAYFEHLADAERYMNTALGIERDNGNETWDISCSLSQEIRQADTWSNALTQLQFGYLEDN